MRVGLLTLRLPQKLPQFLFPFRRHSSEVVSKLMGQRAIFYGRVLTEMKIVLRPRQGGRPMQLVRVVGLQTKRLNDLILKTIRHEPLSGF